MPLGTRTASSLTHESIDTGLRSTLERAFLTLDEDHDGSISTGEVATILQNALGITMEESDIWDVLKDFDVGDGKMFHSTNFDDGDGGGDGKIDFAEFTSFMERFGSKVNTYSESNLKTLFNMICQVQPKTRAPLFVSRTLNATRYSRVTISPRLENLRAACQPWREEKGA